MTKMMKIEILRKCGIGSRHVDAGKVIELPVDEARIVISAGKAIEAETDEQKKARLAKEQETQDKAKAKDEARREEDAKRAEALKAKEAELAKLRKGKEQQAIDAGEGKEDDEAGSETGEDDDVEDIILTDEELLETLESLTGDDLNAFAEDNQIDISGAKDEEEAKSILIDALSGEGAEEVEEVENSSVKTGAVTSDGGKQPAVKGGNKSKTKK
jgi:hypothetical protein